MKTELLKEHSLIKDFKDLSNFEILSLIYSASLFNNLDSAFWKLPNQDNIFIIIDFSGNINKEKIDFSNNSGFVVSPFVNINGDSTLFINCNLIFDLHKRTFIENKSEPLTSLELKNKHNFFAFLKKNISLDNDIKHSTYSSPINKNDTYANEVKYKSLVNDAVDFIDNSSTKKIITSRIEKQSNQDFDPIKSFIKLSNNYKSAFISLISLKKYGTWLGASPEVLIEQKGSQIETVALAGTKQYDKNLELNDYQWSEKEIIEQKLVVDYIRKSFAKYSIPYTETQPNTIQAANLVHLKTNFLANLTDKKFINDLVFDLHPTAAVCGYPKKESLSFILEHELYDRELYTGFLGPLNINGSTNLFVNLRCLQFKKECLIIYVGGGITESSIANDEWNETVIKSQTLLSVINNDL